MKTEVLDHGWIECTNCAGLGTYSDGQKCCICSGSGYDIRAPDPLDMHGACEEFGGSDYAPLDTPEPPPVSNKRPAVWDLVIADMRARDDFGRKKYGTPLQPGNGRDPLVDAYQEALDLAVYLRQAIAEREPS